MSDGGSKNTRTSEGAGPGVRRRLVAVTGPVRPG